MKPEYYSDVYRQFATFMANAPNARLIKIASGASDDDYHWTETLMKNVPFNLLHGVAVHHYSVIEWRRKGPAVDFSEERTRLFDSMYATLENGYSAYNLGYINMSLWYFLSSFCYDDIFHVPYNNSGKDAIDLSIEFMQQNIERALSLKELAAEANLSASHYAALFRKKTGYPPLEYFNHIKIQKACQFLHFTNLQIKEIAYKVGVNDPYYFSRFFSNIMGMSPMEYRNRKH